MGWKVRSSSIVWLGLSERGLLFLVKVYGKERVIHGHSNHTTDSICSNKFPEINRKYIERSRYLCFCIYRIEESKSNSNSSYKTEKTPMRKARECMSLYIVLDGL